MRVIVLILSLASAAMAADYPVVYVAVPDPGSRRPVVQDIDNLHEMEAGSHLRIVHPDGDVEILYEPPSGGGVMDPCVSLDGTKVYCAMTADTTSHTFGDEAAVNLVEIDVGTKAVRQLTFSTEAGEYNTGPCEVPGERLLFTSNRNHLSAISRESGSRHFNRYRRKPVLQGFALQLDDPENTVEQIDFQHLRGSLHFQLLMDGRVMVSNAENHGSLRTIDTWGLQAQYPDGRQSVPLWSGYVRAFPELSFLHFQGQSQSGRVQLVFYYPTKSSGFGNLLDFKPGQGFGPPNANDNQFLADSHTQVRFPFQPISSNDPFGDEPPTRSLTPWTTGKDAGEDGVSHPSGSPDGLLISYAIIRRDEGAGNATRRIRSAGVYLIPDAEVTESPDDLVKVIDTAEFYEVQPRALLPWSDIYGSDPPKIPWLPDSEGKDYGYVGTSSVYARESRQMNGDDFTTDLWVQGADTIDFNNSDIHAVRMVYQAPTPEKYGLEFGQHWKAKGVERMGIRGEIPLRKFDENGNPILDAAGDPDTSFKVKYPADESWTMQLLDKHGRVLTQKFDWNQIRPGETRTDCRGCHAHHEPGIVFDGTVASSADYDPPDLTGSLRFIEWHRDVKPILEAKCMSCHDAETAEGGFVIDDSLRDDTDRVLAWRSTQSLLADVILGTAPDRPQMPPEGEPLTDAERRTIFAWIDLGMPLDEGGFFAGLPPEGEMPDVQPPEPEPDTGEVERLRNALEAIRIIADEALNED